jgi:GMP synthase-like glutamine amidotransferase
VRALHLINQTGGPAALFLPPLRERGCEVRDLNPNDEPLPDSMDGYDALLVCGGIANTHETDRYRWIEPEQALLADALRRGVPTMGLCLGAQLLVLAAGGEVYRTQSPEVGWFAVDVDPDAAGDPVLGAMPPRFMALQWHYYGCELPRSAVEYARSPVCAQAFRIGDSAWGTQFHIEVTREVLEDWGREGVDELARHGYDERRYRLELDRHLPAHMAIGAEMGRRFADHVLARAQLTGVRPSSAA